MTVEQLKSELNKITFSQAHSEYALLCRDMLEAAVSYIFDIISELKHRKFEDGEKRPKPYLYFAEGYA